MATVRPVCWPRDISRNACVHHPLPSPQPLSSSYETNALVLRVFREFTTDETRRCAIIVANSIIAAGEAVRLARSASGKGRSWSGGSRSCERACRTARDSESLDFHRSIETFNGVARRATIGARFFLESVESVAEYEKSVRKCSE